jgi:hypothetical protein
MLILNEQSGASIIGLSRSVVQAGSECQQAHKIRQVASPRIPQMANASGGVFVYNRGGDLRIDPVWPVAVQVGPIRGLSPTRPSWRARTRHGYTRKSQAPERRTRSVLQGRQEKVDG